MARILTGVQSTGKPHLGNILGAMLPAIELSKQDKNESFFFIADLHSLTTIKDAKLRKENTLAVAAAWIAFGFDTDKNTFYRQSDIPEVTELTWYLNCFTPYPMLSNAHSFKDKSDNLSDVNAGLFDYPVLMAADILLYDADFVPVGKDQQQHLEITRDIAGSLNHHYKSEVLKLPQTLSTKEVELVPGTDGRKMSKSYANTIDILSDSKQLKKQVMGIETDSIPLEEPKNPDTCNVFAIYSLLANDDQIAQMRKNYQGGNYGYGHAKKELLELITLKYSSQRERFQQLMDNPKLIELELEKGAKKAKKVAHSVLGRVKKNLGF